MAAVAGGQLGYFIGWRLGPALFKKEDARFFKKHYLASSHEFFEKHGRKTIVIGHFVGVVRTFTPVIAGASGMRYPVFLAYDVVGAAAWGVGLTVVGYHLGGVSFVSAHLEWMVLAVAVLSTVPVIGSVLRAMAGPPPCRGRRCESIDTRGGPTSLTAVFRIGRDRLLLLEEVGGVAFQAHLGGVEFGLVDRVIGQARLFGDVTGVRFPQWFRVAHCSIPFRSPRRVLPRAYPRRWRGNGPLLSGRASPSPSRGPASTTP